MWSTVHACPRASLCNGTETNSKGFVPSALLMICSVTFCAAWEAAERSVGRTGLGVGISGGNRDLRGASLGPALCLLPVGAWGRTPAGVSWRGGAGGACTAQGTPAAVWLSVADSCGYRLRGMSWAPASGVTVPGGRRITRDPACRDSRRIENRADVCQRKHFCESHSVRCTSRQGHCQAEVQIIAISGEHIQRLLMPSLQSSRIESGLLPAWLQQACCPGSPQDILLCQRGHRKQCQDECSLYTANCWASSLPRACRGCRRFTSSRWLPPADDWRQQAAGLTVRHQPALQS